MQDYKFNFGCKEYLLSEENLDYFFNDEEKPIEDFDYDKVISILNESDKVDFDIAYYSKPCDNCLEENAEKKKAYEFLEFHFYVFTKENKYIISSISKEYEENSFSRLKRLGKVDDSYIVSIILCKECGMYTIEVEELEM